MGFEPYMGSPDDSEAEQAAAKGLRGRDFSHYGDLILF